MQQMRIIDTTLREGEQFAEAHFTSAQKRRIARALDAFGVDYIEVTSPAASSRALADARSLANLGLRAKVLAHVRCHPDDIDAAIASGVQGINLFFGTSSFLRSSGHGKSLDEVLDAARASVAPFNTGNARQNREFPRVILAPRKHHRRDFSGAMPA